MPTNSTELRRYLIKILSLQGSAAAYMLKAGFILLFERHHDTPAVDFVN
jgi:hypothetical protein